MIAKQEIVWGLVLESYVYIYIYIFPIGYPHWPCLFYSHLLLSLSLHPLLAIVAASLYSNASRIVSLWIQRGTAPTKIKEID